MSKLNQEIERFRTQAESASEGDSISLTCGAGLNSEELQTIATAMIKTRTECIRLIFPISNRIGSEAAKYIANGLAGTGAQNVNLAFNHFEPTVAKDFAEALARTRARYVNLAYHDFDAAGEKSIVDAVLGNDNQSLEKIEGLSDGSNKSLTNLFERNKARKTKHEKEEQDTISNFFPAVDGPPAIVMDYLRQRSVSVAPTEAKAGVVRYASRYAGGNGEYRLELD